jgi:hypothetical protein
MHNFIKIKQWFFNEVYSKYRNYIFKKGIIKRNKKRIDTDKNYPQVWL